MVCPEGQQGVPWVRHWPDPGLPLLPAKTARLYPDARPLGAGLDVCLARQGSCLLAPAVHPKPGRVCPGCVGELPEGQGRLPEEQRPWPGPRGRPLVATRPQVRGRGRGSRQLPGPAARPRPSIPASFVTAPGHRSQPQPQAPGKAGVSLICKSRSPDRTASWPCPRRSPELGGDRSQRSRPEQREVWKMKCRLF